MLKVQRFWTVKIAGISGIGKTTILKNIQNNKELKCVVITYSTLLKKYGSEDLANDALEKILYATDGLVVMDEHLEFDNPHKMRNYLKENTRGLVLIDAPVQMLLERIKSDSHRKRLVDEKKVRVDLERSRKKALEISREIHLPLLVVPNLDGKAEETTKLIIDFLESVQP